MLKKLLLAVSAMALVLGVFALPVSAVDTDADVSWLNGLTRKVDICIGSTRIGPRLKYGKVLWLDNVPAGTYAFKVRAAARVKCRGQKLASVTPTFTGGGNHTLVIWKPYSTVKVKLFDNDLSVPAAGKSTVTVRHTARRPGAIDVWMWAGVKAAEADFSPTVKGLKKGQSSAAVTVPAGQIFMDVYATKTTRYFSWEGYWGYAEPDTASHAYLIGAKKSNFKIVRLWQPGVLPAP
jgi:hypothetical protein